MEADVYMQLVLAFLFGLSILPPPFFYFASSVVLLCAAGLPMFRMAWSVEG
jgi:hypothetical protein